MMIGDRDESLGSPFKITKPNILNINLPPQYPGLQFLVKYIVCRFCCRHLIRYFAGNYKLGALFAVLVIRCIQYCFVLIILFFQNKFLTSLYLTKLTLGQIGD
jgi:hypothetical protein